MTTGSGQQSRETGERRQWMAELETLHSEETEERETPSPQRKTSPKKRAPLLVAALKKILLFKDLSPSLLQKILRLCELRTYESEDRLCTGGDQPVNELFILLAGKLAVNTVDGLRIATIKPVNIVGEMGFITRRVRSATVTAVQRSHVLIISKASLDHVLRDDRNMQVAVHRNIIDILCSKLVNDNVRTRDFILEKARFENALKKQKQQIDLALDLIMQSGLMDRDQAAAHLDEVLMNHNPRVLVVDDEEALRSMMKEVLSAYVVTAAANGQEALDIARSERPSLVITDIRMPVMDGITLTKKLREEYPDMPVLAVSGVVDPDQVEECDFDGFVEKPINLEEFRTVVEDVLGGSEETASQG